MFWNAIGLEHKFKWIKRIWNKVHLNIFKNMFIFLNVLILTLARRNMICCSYQGYLTYYVDV